MVIARRVISKMADDISMEDNHADGRSMEKGGFLRWWQLAK